MQGEDASYINSITIRYEVNASYSLLELYPMEDGYCLIIHNKKAGNTDKNGQVKFENDTLAEYLMISKQTGDMLLAKRLESIKARTGVKVVSKDTKRKERFTLLKNVAVLVLFVGLIFIAYQFGQLTLDDIYRPAVLAGVAAYTVYFLLGKTGFEVMKMLKSIKPTQDDSVYQFILKKSGDNHKKVAKIATLNKFLRIYYARVKEIYRQAA